MSEPNPSAVDPAAVLDELAKVTAQIQELIGLGMHRPAADAPVVAGVMGGLGQAVAAFNESLLRDPARLLHAQMELWDGYSQLWQRSLAALGAEGEPPPAAAPADRRFRGADWQLPAFDFIRQGYLLTAQWLLERVAGAGDLDPATRRKLAFYTRQYVDAMSPSNFVATNPQVLRATVESGGQNLLHGMQNLLADLKRGDGHLDLRMTPSDAFEVGVNIAATPGKVVYQNGLMQLIQYTPLTEQVYRRPLLVVPPWINKFYVMDLQPTNSLVRWWLEQGYTVFMISWINPGPELAEKSFEDYLLEGPLAVLDAIEQACGEREVNAVGYCIGGTLLMSTLAYMQAKGDERIKSATTFASLLDFSEPGDLGVFIDEEQIAALETRMQEVGYLDSADMATAFNLLRANDLIWSFYVNNYLLGKDPAPFDLLFWNSDATRMPAAMHSFYLRNMYLNNRLREPGGITLAGVPIDLSKVTIPCYLVATAEDHIAPWASVYAGARLLGGRTRFVLSGSGHIAGIINPPAARKYQFWTADGLPATPDAWRAAAQEHPGSWWPDWKFWLGRMAGGKVAARQPGAGALPVIEDAPGSYVRMVSRRGKRMLYHMREIAHAGLAPARIAAGFTNRLLRHPDNPWRQSVPARWLSAGCELFDSITRRYDKPEWGLHRTVIDGVEVPVVEEVIQREPFCDLLHFHRSARRQDPRLLVVAPMSGHYATLLRETVRALLPHHEVYVTDWLDAAMVPLADGSFDLDDYIDYVIGFLHTLGPDTHVLAVCQPAVPVLAAVSLMASRQDPLAPVSMTLIGGPIDTRVSPTVPNDLATEHPIEWFEKNVLGPVPATYPGFGRLVYPGFMQLSGFISMNIQRHIDAHQDFFNHLVEGDGDGADQHRAFYDEYLAVMDTAAEFYLQTIKTVFQEHALPRGVMHHRGERVDPSAIERTALLTIEGGKDDISGPGQTEAAQALCSGLPAARKLHYVQPEVGHYGTFSGRRWREQIAPLIGRFIREHGAAPVADKATPRRRAAKRG